MRRLLASATLVLAAGMSLTACGGPPDDASKDDFCEAYGKVVGADGFDDTKDAFEELADVGTPDNIGDDARDGFEISVDLVDDADDEDEAEEAFDDLDSDDNNKVEALGKYVSKTCADSLGG